MSFVSEGSIGTVTAKAGSATVTFSPSRTIPAGRFVVFWVAWDSIHSVSNPQSTTLNGWWVCHDDAGNIWSTIGGRTDTAGFFGTGAAGFLFVSQLRHELTTSSVITFRAQSASVDAKAISGWEFSIPAGKRWAVTDRGPVTANTKAADPPSISISSLVEQEYLLLWLLAGEGPDSDTYTLDSRYTEIDPDGTTGGSDDSNIHIRGGFRVAEVTGETVDVSSDTADRDYVQILNAVCLIDETPFPTTPILDNFNRADEEPLDFDGAWHPTDTCGPSSPGSPRRLAVVDNRAVSDSSFGAGGQLWQEHLEDCVEVYVDIVEATTAVSGGHGLSLYAHQSGSTENVTQQGLGIDWSEGASGPIAWNIMVGEAGNQGKVTSPRFISWYDLASGYKLGFKRVKHGDNAVDRGFVDIGDGWEEIGGVVRTSPVYEEGRLGLAMWADADDMVCDNFGGGPTPCFGVVFRPYFIRPADRRPGRPGF